MQDVVTTWEKRLFIESFWVFYNDKEDCKVTNSCSLSQICEFCLFEVSALQKGIHNIYIYILYTLSFYEL